MASGNDGSYNFYSSAVTRAIQHAASQYAALQQGLFEWRAWKEKRLTFDSSGNVLRFRNDDGAWLDDPFAIYGVIATFRQHAREDALPKLSRQVQQWLHTGMDESTVCRKLAHLAETMDERTHSLRLKTIAGSQESGDSEGTVPSKPLGAVLEK